MAINSNQLHVAKIYPGNYTNVLRYWHEEKTMQFENANGVQTSYTNQPVGGPVGVVFRPGWIAQQAVGYVDLSYQALGTNNQFQALTQDDFDLPFAQPLASLTGLASHLLGHLLKDHLPPPETSVRID